MDLQPLGASGVFGEMILVRWSFAKECGVPPEVVCKFPQKELKTKALAAAMGLYSQELNYYRFLQPTAAVRVPRMIFGEIHYRSRDYIMFIEKITGTRDFQRDAEAITADDCIKVMRTIGKFHAPYVGRSGAAELAWVARFDNPDCPEATWFKGEKSSEAFTMKLLFTRKNWDKGLALFRTDPTCLSVDGMEPAVAVFDTLTPRFDELVANVVPLCLAIVDPRLGWRGLRHGDTRIDNVSSC